MDPHLLTPLDCIGKGSSASVFTCLENKLVVIKQFKRKRDFEMEMRALQLFKDCDFVVEMLGSCCCCHQIVLRRYKTSLENLIQNTPRPDDITGIRLVLFRMAALLCERKFYHNDFKAKNILVGATSFVLCDFSDWFPQTEKKNHLLGPPPHLVDQVCRWLPEAKHRKIYK